MGLVIAKRRGDFLSEAHLIFRNVIAKAAVNLQFQVIYYFIENCVAIQRKRLNIVNRSYFIYAIKKINNHWLSCFRNVYRISSFYAILIWFLCFFESFWAGTFIG